MLDPLMVHLMVLVTVDQLVSLLELDLVHLMVKTMEILLEFLKFLNSCIKDTMNSKLHTTGTKTSKQKA